MLLQQPLTYGFNHCKKRKRHAQKIIILATKRTKKIDLKHKIEILVRPRAKVTLLKICKCEFQEQYGLDTSKFEIKKEKDTENNISAKVLVTHAM